MSERLDWWITEMQDCVSTYQAARREYERQEAMYLKAKARMEEALTDLQELN